MSEKRQMHISIIEDQGCTVMMGGKVFSGITELNLSYKDSKPQLEMRFAKSGDSVEADISNLSVN